ALVVAAGVVVIGIGIYQVRKGLRSEFLGEIDLRTVAPALCTLTHRDRTDGVLAVTVHCRSARDFVPAAFDAARAEGATISHVEVVPVTLEDVFISLTGRALRE
ncbi:MAG TPA: hypothetical protein VHK28_06470, partial [Candidatus Limnocylindria bacterium]|nr:hypothetical protein [Candidatus Limnocylindria bacterium]